MNLWDSLFKRWGGNAGQAAWNVSVGQVPVIGQFLGAYIQAANDPVDLDNPFSGSDVIDFTGGFGGWDSRDSTSKRSVRYAENYSDIADGASGGSGRSKSLLSSPDLLADNTPVRASTESWMNYRADYQQGSLQEIQLDVSTRGPARQSPPIEEVFVRGPPRQKPTAPDRPSRQSDMPQPMDRWRSRVPSLDGPKSAFPSPSPTADVPEKVAPPRPELLQPPEVPSPEGQWVNETVIEAEPPFQPMVSDPRALEAAEGRGRIQLGDLIQLGRGSLNGLVASTQELLRLGTRQIAGPIYAPLVEHLAEPVVTAMDDLRLDIDPRFAGAGIIGEQLAENLSSEALPLVPKFARGARRALRRRTLTPPKLVGFAPVLHYEDWAIYQRQVGSAYEPVFEITVGKRKYQFRPDHMEGLTLVEAKHGDMRQLFNADWHAKFQQQVKNYLILIERGGYTKVVYRVSTQKGAQNLLKLFSHDYPAELLSGKIQVEHVPFKKGRF